MTDDRINYYTNLGIELRRLLMLHGATSEEIDAFLLVDEAADPVERLLDAARADERAKVITQAKALTELKRMYEQGLVGLGEDIARRLNFDALHTPASRAQANG